MFEKITVLLKQGLEIDVKLIEKIKEIFSKSDINVVGFDDFKKMHLENQDLVITLGGDGTFVKAANLVVDSLIIGINCNPGKSEGALTSIDSSGIDKLKGLTNGNYEVLKRWKARVRLNGRILDEEATNEVYIGAASQFHTSRYKIKFKDFEEEHRSSGVIVSTGTGSPAWFLSAGGKVFDPSEEKLGFVVREPYFGKKVFTPQLLSGFLEKKDKIILESERDFGGIIAINDSIYDFNRGDIVEVELSNNPLKVVRLK